MKVIRLYYWFKGAPISREGGPWWYKDFPNIWERAKFLNDGKAFFKDFFIYSGEDIAHTPMNIYPPRQERTNIILNDIK